MKKAHTASARKTTAKPSSVRSQLWAAVHPKPALPIGHPIPRLTPPPVPTPRKAQRSPARQPAAVDYLASLLCVWFALALLVTGCVGPRPLKGGKAVTARNPAGVIEQTLVQGENPSQATKQAQETVKVRTYTVPAGSRVEQSSLPAFHEPQYEQNDLLSLSLSPSKGICLAR